MNDTKKEREEMQTEVAQTKSVRPNYDPRYKRKLKTRLRELVLKEGMNRREAAVFMGEEGYMRADGKPFDPNAAHQIWHWISRKRTRRLKDQKAPEGDALARREDPDTPVNAPGKPKGQTEKTRGHRLPRAVLAILADDHLSDGQKVRMILAYAGAE